MITLSDGKLLVRFAREAILSYFSSKPIKTDISRFSDKQGVFVTLTKHGQLRGCIGFPEPVLPLNKAIFQAARAAALEDPRFPPLDEAELGDIEVEVSVLTRPEQMTPGKPEDCINKIVIGKHGLIIRHGPYSGLLLPQVFIDYKSTPLKALEMTCEKAGLPNGAWKDKDAKLYLFSAQIFKEEEPGGNVVEEKQISS